MSRTLYRKWRPQSWDQVIGQQHVVQTLQNALAADRVAHAYLFAGPRGTGKTTTARLLAKAVNCLQEDLSARPCGECAHCLAVNQGRFLDLIEIDAASNTSVEDVRDLRDKINFSPSQGRYKIYIIDEVHMLSTAAFNALLKTLEEPPSHAIFVLATTEVHRIPATVLSRCQRHEFRRIPAKDIVTCLQKIAETEKIEVEPQALALIARQSTGAMRDAISLLDQLASTGNVITLDTVHEVLGTATSQSVLDLVQSLVDKDAAKGLECINNTVNTGSDPRQYARQVVEYLRELLIMRMGNANQIDTTPDLRIMLSKHAQEFPPAELLRLLRIFNQAATEGRSTWQPTLPLEMALLDALETPPTPSEKQLAEVTSLKPSASTKTSKTQPAPTSVASTEAQSAAPPHVTATAEKQSAGADEAQTEDQQASQNLTANWDRILNLVRQKNPNTYGLMNSCCSRFIRGNQVLVGFRSNLLKEKMEKDVNRELAQKVISQVIQREVIIRCFVDTRQQGVIPPEVDEDGIVAAALRDLGGELVDMN